MREDLDSVNNPHLLVEHAAFLCSFPTRWNKPFSRSQKILWGHCRFAELSDKPAFLHFFLTTQSVHYELLLLSSNTKLMFGGTNTLPPLWTAEWSLLRSVPQLYLKVARMQRKRSEGKRIVEFVATKIPTIVITKKAPVSPDLVHSNHVTLISVLFNLFPI